jgi:hypothetical protein
MEVAAPDGYEYSFWKTYVDVPNRRIYADGTMTGARHATVEVDATIDWLIEKNRSGYKMVNSVRRLEEMKAFMRGKLQEWDCRAGQNSLIIRTDGTLAPCFPMYSAAHDWGMAGRPRFEKEQLAGMKVECQKRCFSTLNHNLAYCYDASRAIRWTRPRGRFRPEGATHRMASSSSEVHPGAAPGKDFFSPRRAGRLLVRRQGILQRR